MIDWELDGTYCMPIDDIPNENALETDDVDKSHSKVEVDPIINEA
jgi:hypothetical protein